MSTDAHNPDGTLMGWASATLKRRRQVLMASFHKSLRNKQKPLKRTQADRNKAKAARRARRQKGQY